MLFLKLALAATAAFAINGAVARAASVDVQPGNDQMDNQSEVLQTPNCQANNPDDSIACQAREACVTGGLQDQACQTYCADFSNDSLCQVAPTGEQAMWGGHGGGWHGGHGGWHGGGWHGGGFGPGRGFCFYHPYAPRCRY